VKSIIAKNLKKYYNTGKPNEVRALHNVNLEVDEGDLVAIIGPSGSGKSTLMHILGILDQPQSGTLTVRGTEVAKVPRKALPQMRAKEIGFIFQGFNLLPTQTAIENVAEAAHYGGLSMRKAKEAATEVLTQVGLADRLDNFPNQLSGGQQQRVAIARALVNNPAIILGDEPTGELDSVNAEAIMDLLITLNKERGQTIIIVTHNREIAERCRTVVTMRDGEIASITTKHHD
jgi:ABC-type lipoprotein export system ATPase subunit